ncbi:uncharacterized protein LOC143855861 [Tasmannia lanceolata]|uniref:uncharacterized protein LOC143855861 n=1 Tax=Tasmannia lanceolata TaxID=3420 RepID=UPI004062CD65
MIVEHEIPGTTWSMYFDGAVNHQGRGIGAVLVSPRKEYTPISIKLQFECTNNMAEYEACIAGLESTLALNIQDIDVFGDLILIICQTKGCWRTREDRLFPYQEYLGSLVSKFRNITFTHLPRVKNHFADAFATLVSMLELSATTKVQPLAVRLQWAPTHVNAIEIATRGPDGKPWYTDIKDLISGKGHPAETSGKERRTLQKLASNFIICGEELYRRPFNGIQVLCVDEDRAAKIIEQIHEVWGIYIIGKVSSKSSSGHEYILVAIDSFTKWVEAASYASLSSASVARFIRTNMTCRYGVPHELIPDNGSHFKKEVTHLCEEFKIKHHKSSPYRPQTNGAVEAANKTVKVYNKLMAKYNSWNLV